MMTGKRASPWLIWGVAAMITLPVLFVLSFGPATWARSKGYMSEPVYEGAYMWLWHAAEACGPYGWLDRYFEYRLS